MMNNNNHHIENCGYAAEIVAYIYGEIAPREKNAFENHLARCSDCADEIAEFANVSQTIGAWRDAEFAKLPIPQIVIPYETNAVKSESVSWFDGLREVFARSASWTTAGAAMAAIIVCVGLIFTAVKFSGSNDVAELDNRNSIIPLVSPTAEIKQNPSKEITVSAPESAPTETVQTDLKEVKPKNKPTQTVVKTADAPTPKVVRLDGDTIVPVNQNKPNDANKPKAKPAPKKSVPTLDDYEETEDDSLRLAELLDDIDTEK